MSFSDTPLVLYLKPVSFSTFAGSARAPSDIPAASINTTVLPEFITRFSNIFRFSGVIEYPHGKTAILYFEKSRFSMSSKII